MTLFLKCLWCLGNLRFTFVHGGCFINIASTVPIDSGALEAGEVVAIFRLFLLRPFSTATVVAQATPLVLSIP